MAHRIKKSWISLLGEDPRLLPDVLFQVTEELFVDGTKAERTELVGAHKFVLSMASDVFKAQFYHQILEKGVRNNIDPRTIVILLVFLLLGIIKKGHKFGSKLVTFRKITCLNLWPFIKVASLDPNL